MRPPSQETAEPTDEARLQIPVRRTLRPRPRWAGWQEASANGVAPQLVEQQPAGGTPGQPNPLQRGEVARDAAAEVIVDEGELGGEDPERRGDLLLLEDQPLQHDACGDVPVADRAGERVTALERISPAGSVQTTSAGRSSWPIVSEASKLGPAAPGPLQIFGSRTQR